jgi:hypothetical protein
MRNDLTESDGPKGMLTGTLSASRRIVQSLTSGDDEGMSDSADTGVEDAMDRRTYLQAAGGIATFGLGDGLPGLSGTRDPTRPLVTDVAEPELYGYGGRPVGTGGGTTVAAGGRAPTDTVRAGEAVEHAATASSGERVGSDLDAGGPDWYVLEAGRNDPIHLTYDGGDAAGTTALFLYGPGGELRERVSAGRGHSEVLFGVADSGGTHLVQAVDVGRDGGEYTLDVRTGDLQNSLDAASTGDQSPYDGTSQSLPGTVQAQRFDEGGESVAYHDTTDANHGGAFRTDEAVDVQSVSDASGEYNVGWIADGEWLEYTVDVTAGTGTLSARVASPDGGEFEVGLDGTTLGTVEVPDTGGWQRWQTVTLDGVDVEASGEAVLRVDVVSGGFNLNWLRFEGQRPFEGARATVPGTIQAQKFDEGGEGIAYHDTTDANRGGAFRPDEAVDIQRTDDASGEYNVGYVASGEWLEYTVDATAGTYTLRARAASAAGGGEFEMFLDGTSLGTVAVPDTGGWQNWQTVTLDDVTVSADGTAVLRVEAKTDGFNLNWFRFEGQRPYAGNPQAIPGKVQAEKFDEGGEGVAYHDTTDGNSGGAFRPDEAVDVESADAGPNVYNVGWIADGEWLEYTVDATPGTYEVGARVASAGGGGQFSMSLDDESLGTIDVPDTGGWQNWQTVTLDGVEVDASGSTVLRVEAKTDGFNLNWLSFRTVDEESYGEQGYGESGYGGTS